MPNRSDWITSRAHELRHLERADRHIAALNRHIVRQRTVVQGAIDKGRPSLEEESLLSALEASRRTFEKHRERILHLLANGGWPLPQPSSLPASEFPAKFAGRDVR